MEFVSIPNLATAPQAPHSAAGIPSSDKSADSGGTPSFAQVVREVLVRTTTQNDTQSAHTTHSSSSATSGNQRSLFPVSREARAASSQPVDPSALNLLSFTNQSAMMPPPTSATCNSQTTTATADSSAPQSAAPSPADATPASPSALAQASLPPPLADQTIQAAMDQLSASRFPDTSTSLSDKNLVAAGQLQTNASNLPGDPSASRKSIADLQMMSGPPASPNGVPISFVLPQIAQLQPTAPANASATAGPLFTAPHSAMTQATTKAALALAPLFAALPAAFALPVSNMKNAPLAPAGPQPVVLPANSPSSNHSGSQDSSSDTGAQKPADSSATSGPTISRDASAFSQALATANGAKPEAAPAAANQASVIPVASVPPNDRPAASAAASSPSAPANPPQPAFHPLDAAANRIVSDAQLSQNSGHSEMRIVMQTEKLGAVELRARVAGNEIGAAITVEKRDAHAALAVELPALQQALSEKQLRVDQIALLHGSLHSTTGDAGAQSQAHQGDRGTHRAQIAQSFLRDDSGAFASSQSAVETWGIFDSQGRLSVQA